MPKFKNEYGVSKIKYTQKCRCFCPIGKADYTNNFTVTITPKQIWHAPQAFGRLRSAITTTKLQRE